MGCGQGMPSGTPKPPSALSLGEEIHWLQSYWDEEVHAQIAAHIAAWMPHRAAL